MAFDIISYLMGSQSSGGGGSTGGINFKSVILEDDGNYTAVDTKNNTHIITPTINSDGVITAIVYDDVSINLTYDSEGNLTKIGDSDVDVSDYVGVGIVPSGEIEITENGEYDITDKATATVNVSGGSGFPVAEYTFTSDFFDHSLKLFQDYVQQYMTKQNAYYYIKFEGNSTNDYYIRDMQTVWFTTYGTTYFFRYENNTVNQNLISSAFSAYVKAGTVMKVYTLS